MSSFAFKSNHHLSLSILCTVGEGPKRMTLLCHRILKYLYLKVVSIHKLVWEPCVTFAIIESEIQRRTLVLFMWERERGRESFGFGETMFGCKCFYWKKLTDLFPPEPEPFSLPDPNPQWPPGMKVLVQSFDLCWIVRFVW